MVGLDPRLGLGAPMNILFSPLCSTRSRLVAAYFLTERWQRWRQRRDFQYRVIRS
jgi:hypothetical protein